MQCPRCQSFELRAYNETIPKKYKTNIDGDIRRRRICNECGLTVWTNEIIEKVQVFDRKAHKSKYLPIEKYLEISEELYEL